MRYFRSISCAVMIALFVVGCGGDDGGGGGDEGVASETGRVVIGAAPNLGAVFNATVNFYKRDGTTLLARGRSGVNGIFVAGTRGYVGPVVVEIVGSRNARYYDESAGTVVRFPTGSKMYAIVPRPGVTIAVTTLTDIAYRQARAQRLFPLSACEVGLLNFIVRASLAPGLTNILSVPTRFSANTTRGSLKNNEAGRHAAVLAALARLGAGAPAPALSVFTYLRIDATDGVIDGRIKGGRLVRQPALYTSFGDFDRRLQLAINRVIANFGSAALKLARSQLGPHDRNVGDGMVEERCAPPPPPPPPPPPTGGTGGTGSGGGGGI